VRVNQRYDRKLYEAHDATGVFARRWLGWRESRGLVEGRVVVDEPAADVFVGDHFWVVADLRP